jgi:hypothetical protein
MAKSKGSDAGGSLLSEIAAAIADKGNWLERLPPDAVEELSQVRERFRSGGLSGKPYQIAHALIAAGEARGWSMPSEKSVVTWLRS